MNIDLPIAEYDDRILSAVANGQVTIVTAETGAGKSTQVPQFLHRAGYQVVVTQPRRLAARSVALRVAEELGGKLGDLVGYRTGQDRLSSAQTEILFCTDGLQLVRELTGHGVQQQVLVIDEVHEWNVNIETLVAWVKLQIARDSSLKVVLMSATLEADKLAAHFGGAKIISVPGRTFPVERRDIPGTPAQVAAKLASEGRNVLVFVTGKPQIEEVIDKLASVADQYVVLPLHGQLTAEEQAKAFAHYGKPKIIIATNVAQTSITIDDIDAVVDTGLERRVEVRDGVEGTFICNISQADCLQRMGRAGRTKPGVYVLCSDVPFENRPEFQIAEILRVRLDQLVLRLAVSGIDATELEFFHQPERSVLVDAKGALQRLGAFDKQHNVTEMGEAMSHLPVDVHHARMLIEAQRRNVLGSVMSIVACIEAGGIRGNGKKEGRFQSPPQWRALTQETQNGVSDLLAELDVYHAARRMSRDEMFQADIMVKNFGLACDIRERLTRSLGGDDEVSTTDTPIPAPPRARSTASEARPIPAPPASRTPRRAEKAEDNRQEILKACMTGMIDHVYTRSATGSYSNGDNVARELDRNSSVKNAKLITGMPFDLEIDTQHGPVTLMLVNNATKVEPALLMELAPELVSHAPGGYVYSVEHHEIMTVTLVLFNGQEIGQDLTETEPNPVVTATLAAALATGKIAYSARDHNQMVTSQVNTLSRRYPGRVQGLDAVRLMSIFSARLGNIYRVADLDGVDLKLELSELVPIDLVEEVTVPNSEVVETNGVSLKVSYQEAWAGTMTATVQIRLSDLANVRVLPDLPKASRVSRIEITDDDGNVVSTSMSLTQAKHRIAAVEKQMRLDRVSQEYMEEVVELSEACDRLAADGREVSNLRNLISKARYKASSMASPYRPTPADAVRQAIVLAQAEVDRLSGDIVEVMVDDLMSGRLWHRHIEINKETLRKIDEYVIRSGEFFERVTDDQLRKFYTERLEGVTSAEEAVATDLELDIQDYVLTELLGEIDDLAPESIELESRKGLKHYEVSYSYRIVDNDEMKAIGTVSVPVVVYENNCGSHGKQSNFPELPHEITLVIQVTENGKLLAEGTEDSGLSSRVSKKKGKKGGKAKDDERNRQARLLALGHKIEGPTAPPPWFRG